MRVKAEATSKHWHGALIDRNGIVGGGALLGLDIKIVQAASSKWALASQASVCEYYEELTTDQQMYGVGKPIEQHSGMHRD